MTGKTILIAGMIAAGASAAGVQAVQAQPMIYRCEMKSAPSRSFMSKKYAFLYDAQTGKAKAVDGLIWLANKRWIPVKVEVANARRVTFGWTVRNVPASTNGKPGQIPGVRESATLILGSQRLFVTQYPLGADNSFSAEGSCSAQVWKPRRG